MIDSVKVKRLSDKRSRDDSSDQHRGAVGEAFEKRLAPRA
jgi:hypothetical protein